jgi:hypothetical protein
MIVCAICGADKIQIVWAEVCVRCDWPLEWPLWSDHVGLISKAHMLGVGRLPRN